MLLFQVQKGRGFTQDQKEVQVSDFQLGRAVSSYAICHSTGLF